MSRRLNNALWYSLTFFTIVGTILGILLAIMIGFLTLLETHHQLAIAALVFVVVGILFFMLFKLVWWHIDEEDGFL